MSFRPAAVSVLAIAGLCVAASTAMGPSSNGNATAVRTASRPVDGAGVEGSSVGLVPAAVPAPVIPHGGQSVFSAQAHVDGGAHAITQAAAQYSIPDLPAVRGIPEIALAAYRNAELRLAQAEPNCGLTWDLLAGIGRIESGHAGGGATDASGTTLSPILGPALDGSLPGNEIIKNAAGGYVRAVGPMQFLPSTWRVYADPGADINNVFDAALTAGKYLCSGGMDLRDPGQRLRAVLRYNNSMAYAQNVLSWASIYRTGGDDGAFTGLVPSPAPDYSIPATPEAADPETAEPTPTPAPESAPAPLPQSTPAPQPPMIIIPGLPPIPCGIFCPPAPAAPASPGEPATGSVPAAGPEAHDPMS